MKPQVRGERPAMLGKAALLSAAALWLCGCPVPDLFAPDKPPRRDPPAVATGPILNEPPPPPRPRVRLLWRGKVPAELGPWLALPDGTAMAGHVASLLGVDRDNRRAFFTRDPSREAPWFEVVEVPLDEANPDQPPLSRWTANSHDPHLRAFHPFGGTFNDDLLRYAAIVETTGPFVTRTRDAMFGPKIAVSKDAILFEAPPDDLRIADRTLQHSRRIITLPAAYDPIFSADGTAAAFRGCHNLGAPLPGRLISCQYHLYIAHKESKTPARIQDVTRPQPPLFSPDGRYVYTVSRDDAYLAPPIDRGGCLWRVAAAPPHQATKLWCTSELYELELHEDPSGATCVVEGRRGAHPDWKPELVWIDLPGGRVRATLAVENGASLGTLGKNGLYATHARGGLAFIDLASGKVARVARPQSEQTFFSDHWADDTTVYALRQRVARTPVEEVLAIDVRAELDAAQ